MKDLLERWKSYIEGEKFDVEKIPAVLKRCPKCYSLSLEYDPKTGRLYCTKCGFEVYLPKTGEE